MDWTREEIESLRGWERPRVRARVGDGYRDGERRFRDAHAEIVPDGNNPWLVVRTAHGIDIEFRLSWGLLLEVLNDPRTSPVWIEDNRPAEHRGGYSFF